MKKFFILVLCVCGALSAWSVESLQTYKYVQRDTGWLQLDLYRPSVHRAGSPTVVYFYGGGFAQGTRNNSSTLNYCMALQQQGYTVVAVDYRLGMQGKSKVGVKTIEESIMMAATDGMAAVAYLIEHAQEFGIKTQQIYLVGSSAGAITSLQIDYMWANGNNLGSKIPDNFRFAGIVSYAGGIFSREGKPDYKSHAPAPTLFLHGTDDYIVPYKKIQVACMGMFGTDALIKRFEKFHYSYYARRYETLGHQVANFNRITIPLLNYFVTVFGLDGQHLEIDEFYYDESIKPQFEGREGRKYLKQIIKDS